MTTNYIPREILASLIIKITHDWIACDLPRKMAYTLYIETMGTAGNIPLDALLLNFHSTCKDWVGKYFEARHYDTPNQRQCDAIIVLMLMEVFRIVACLKEKAD